MKEIIGNSRKIHEPEGHSSRNLLKHLFKFKACIKNVPKKMKNFPKNHKNFPEKISPKKIKNRPQKKESRSQII